MVHFYHNKGIDMVKLGCTLQKLATICFHKSTAAKFYLFTESDRDFLAKIREDMVDGRSDVFTMKAVVDETFFGIRQTGPKPLSKLMLVSFILSLCVRQQQLVCTRGGSLIWNLANINRVETKRGVLKARSCHTFSEFDHSVKWKVFTRQVYRKKLTHTVLVDFVDTATLC